MSLNILTRPGLRPDAASLCGILANPIAMVAALRPLRGTLSARDYWQLQEHRRRSEEVGTGHHPLLAALIRARMEDAQVVLDEDLEPDIARGGGRVSYILDGRAYCDRLLYHWGYPDTRQAAVPVASLLGATLIGMRAGQHSVLPRSDGSRGVLELTAVSGCCTPHHCER